MATAMRAPMPRDRITSWMNYPYRNAWRDIPAGARGGRPTSTGRPCRCRHKPFPFHSEKWIAHVKRTGGTVAAFDCGHCVQRDPALGEILATWLRRSGH